MKLLAMMSLLASPLLASASAQQASMPRDTRPIYAYLALPRIGTTVPDFDYALAGGGRISPAALRGAPTVLVLWSTWCGASRAVFDAIQSLHADYATRGVRVVLLADDSMAELDRFRKATKVNTPLASAPDLMARFDFSSTAPERDSLRVAFALPSVLVLDAAGRVVSRDIIGRSSFTWIRVTLDSLAGRIDRGLPASVPAAPPRLPTAPAPSTAVPETNLLAAATGPRVASGEVTAISRAPCGTARRDRPPCSRHAGAPHG